MALAAGGLSPSGLENEVALCVYLVHPIHFTDAVTLVVEGEFAGQTGEIFEGGLQIGGNLGRLYTDPAPLIAAVTTRKPSPASTG